MANGNGDKEEKGFKRLRITTIFWKVKTEIIF